MIKAIETHYKGYRFRSRLEARWAVFFDELGVKWEYEPEGFDVNGRWYLPDFLLPEVNLRTTGGGNGLWIEIKPEYLEGDDTHLQELALGTNRDLALLIGSPAPSSENTSHGHCQFATWGYDTPMEFVQCSECKRIKFEFPESNYMRCEVCAGLCNPESPALLQATRAARSARFEFGETPR